MDTIADIEHELDDLLGTARLAIVQEALTQVLNHDW